MVISSLDNKKVKFINSLKISRKRKEFGLFLVEGMHLVKEAYLSGFLEEIYLLENSSLDFSCDIEPTYVTYEVMKKITSLDSPSDVIGICQMKTDGSIIGNRLLLLDNIQDPGNLGTIIRSCCAFNVDTLILSKNTVDIYNEKVIRSTQGMIFHLNFLISDLEEIIPTLKNDGYLIIGTNVNNGIDVRSISPSKFALIMGNEGSGVSENIQKLCDQNLYIKMNELCESLNVGVATSILLYELGGYNE